MKRKILALSFIALALICLALGITFACGGIKLTSVLKNGGLTEASLVFLRENFGINGDAFVVVEGTKDDTELEKAVTRIQNISGVTTVVWYGYAGTIDALMALVNATGGTVDTTKLRNYLRVESGGKYFYTLIVAFDFDPASKKAKNVHDAVYKILRKEMKRDVAISGMTALTQRENENAQAIFFGLAVCFLIGAGFAMFKTPRQASLATPLILLEGNYADSFFRSKNKEFPSAEGCLFRGGVVFSAVLFFAFILSISNLYTVKPSKTASEIAEALQNQVVIAVPVKADRGQQKDFADALTSRAMASDFLSVYSAVEFSQSGLETFAKYVTLPPLFSKVGDATYTLYMVKLIDNKKTDALMTVVKERFDTYYVFGLPTANAEGSVDLFALVNAAEVFAGLILYAAAFMGAGYLSLSVLTKTQSGAII